MLTAGVDVGGTKILAVAVDAGSGRVVGDPARAPTPKIDAGALVDAVGAAVEQVETAIGRPVDAVGVGLPGLVDRSGTLAMGPHLPGIIDHDFADAFHARLGGR